MLRKNESRSEMWCCDVRETCVVSAVWASVGERVASGVTIRLK